MGFIRNVFSEMEDQWERAKGGDVGWLTGIPRQGTGNGGTEYPPNSLTEKQRDMLERLFHQDYGRFPQSEYEFQTWLRHNW